MVVPVQDSVVGRTFPVDMRPANGTPVLARRLVRAWKNSRGITDIAPGTLVIPEQYLPSPLRIGEQAIVIAPLSHQVECRWQSPGPQGQCVVAPKDDVKTLWYIGTPCIDHVDNRGA